MTAKLAWDKFFKTGAVQDYIKYCQISPNGDKNATCDGKRTCDSRNQLW